MVIPGPNGIELDVWNDGIFFEDPLRYENGVSLNVYVARLSLKELTTFLIERTNCAHVFSIYYKMPHSDLDKGLVRLDSDWECNRMYDLSRLFGKLEVYIDHTNLDMSKYLAIHDPGTPTSKYRATPDKRYCNELTDEELLHWAEQEAEHDIGITSASDKGKASASDKGKGKESSDKGKSSVSDKGKASVSDLAGETHHESSDSDDSDFGNNGMLEDSDSEDSDYSDKSVDYLSAYEEELIEHRTRRASRRKTRAPPIPDMAANPGTSSATRGSRSEVFLEHDEFINELLRKMNEVDSDGNIQDPFLGVQANEDRYPTHDESTHWRLQVPKVGLKFESAAKLKEALTYYALANGYSIWYERSATDKVIALCGQRPPKALKDPEKGKQRKQYRFPSETKEDVPKCTFRLYARWMSSEKTFQIITLKPEHSCVRNFQFGSLVDYKWIGKRFGEKIRRNPEIKLVDIAALVLKKYKCTVSSNQCRYAKAWALTEYEQTVEEHYALLRSYGKELLDSNPGSTVKLGVTHNEEGSTVFDRFYVCLGGLKEGFKRGCRRVIALDGCFLKRPNHGEILTAIGRDGNNQIYPIAWAVVGVENKDNWSWFLDLIGDDLEMPTGQGLTLMSDQHKGLIEAVKQVMPQAEHRQCARHIYENFRKQFSGLEFRNLFWAASKASYPQLFNKIMEKIKAANPKAHKYLMEKDPKTWSRAFFELGRGCEAVENGFSECFNSVLVTVRDKPILTMLEAIRVIVLEKMNTCRNISAKWTDDICPSIKKRVDLLKDDIRFWHVIPAGGNAFEVRNGSHSFKVNVDLRTCSCRMWQLSGLPCVHGTAAIFKLNKVPCVHGTAAIGNQNLCTDCHLLYTNLGNQTMLTVM